ncbi:MAG: hypothetical protein Q4F84_08800, partial [Fibrobacter sp.]|nr:hypothetical protein [Fibrobacter sp.]
MKLKSIITSVAACVLVVGIFCAEWNNPYLDKSNSCVEILKKSFSDKDTVEIFSGESLTVVVYLREHIESFGISVPGNRLWNTTEDSVVTGSELDKGLLSFAFSFYDTGWHDITLTTNFNDSTPSKTQTFSLFAKSPLSQKRINAINGDSVLLETAPVKDKDVQYVWELGTVIKNENPSVKTKFNFSDTAFDGKLYVEDRDSKFRSSPFVFPVQFSKSALETFLEIACVNSPMQGDTVLVSSGTYTFSVKVTGADKLEVATVNGETFDTKNKDSDGAFLLNRKFSGLDTLENPLEVHVYCKNENGVTKDSYFYLKYKSKVVVAS